MADPYEEAWNQMLLRRQKARQLEQKVCLGLELAPAFPWESGFFFFLYPTIKSLCRESHCSFFRLLYLF